MSYCGARGPISLTGGAELGDGWLIQPKFDGCYVSIHTDRDGRVHAVTSRNGRVMETGLRGLELGVPWAELAAEYTGHTEAGLRRAALDGYDTAHVFDAVRLDGKLLAGEPFAARWEALGRARGAAMARDNDRPWLDDARGNAHERGNGRFTRRVPLGWRRFPLVPIRFAHLAGRCWRDWVEDGTWCEGLVFVAERAPIGRRRAKLKCKPRETLDAVVIAVDASTALLRSDALGLSFTVSARSSVRLRCGDVVEVAYQGFYERTNEPRFARLVRLRDDL